MYKMTSDEAVFVAIDLETTGFSPETSSVIEVAAVKFQGGFVLNKYWELTKPDEGYIPKRVSQLTGITNAMVIDRPTFFDIYPELYNFIKNSVVIAHNAKFDLSFLNYTHQKRFRESLKIPYICTDMLARRLFPEIGKKSLECVANHLGIKFKQSHRAMSDALATYEIFQKITEILHDYNVDRVLDIIKFAEGKKINPKSKRKRYV